MIICSSINMASLIIFSLISILSFSPAISQESKAIHLETGTENHALKQIETYIVHVSLPDGVKTSQLEDLESQYHSFLPKTPTGLHDVSRIVFSYRNVITGFAARLSAEEVKEMEKKEGFLLARPQEILTLHTTRSPKFMGLDPNFGFWPQSELGKGVIIGVVDGGIKPDHASFSDKGMSPPPPEWKGKCDLNGTKCNNKLIGARKFAGGTSRLPVDVDDHGTHTSSTAAGNFVESASIFGQANGTAAGMAPRAHLAMYQVCVPFCAESATLAAMDAAIEEGVNVLSLSLGFNQNKPFYEDSMAIGAFRAIQRGVFVSCSAGNSGPFKASLNNDAPWILTVGASTIDRSIRATAVLGNGDEFDGESLSQPKDFPPVLLPLVYPGMNGDPSAANCNPGSLNSTAIREKVVLCDSGMSEEAVKDAGAAAVIIINDEYKGYVIAPETHVLPATVVPFAAGQKIKAYINSTPKPTATILFKGTVLGVKNAPIVTYFSSRGPSVASPGILKPDIIGPGFSILAAWPYSEDNTTNSTSAFYLASGTSMSCPHLSGIAALLKSVHPSWSPAAIKSAIMTTAYILNLNHSRIPDHRLLPADMFAIGAGHVNPSRAAKPGLIYDILPDDYIPYLCGLGYTDTNISIIVQRPIRCSSIGSIPEAQLNYPSFAIQLGSTTQTYTRTVTNVGKARSTYNVEIEKIPGVDVQVQPSTLNFTKVKQRMVYGISFSRSGTAISKSYVEGAITWVSKEHRVRSPISVELL